MEKPKIIKIIDKFFFCMVKNKENEVVIRLFKEVTEIYSLSDKLKETKGVQISLIIESGYNLIEIRYSDNSSNLFPFETIDEKYDALKFLKKNDILPTIEEFLMKNPSRKSLV
jgi:hypothetical protein